MAGKQNNYEQMRDQMRPYFLTFDQEGMIRKFQLAHDCDYLYLRFCGRDYRVGRTTGIVEWSEDHFESCHEGDYNESMTIYDILCYSKSDCHLCGEFAPTGSLKGVVLTSMNAGNALVSSRISGFFDANIHLLDQACIALGGIPAGKGDVAYQLPLFDFLPVRFAFWRADEDFPPEIQMLWDTNILSFMHFETIWFAAGHLLSRIEELMRQAK